MMVMTAKVDKKKIAVIAAAVAGLILAIILLWGGGNSTETAATAVSGNDSRLVFLQEMGWQISDTPVESG